jgi:L-threonylcarbamoyladenylate synthase
VINDLSGKIDMILYGGPCKHGLESTIVDFSEVHPKILRPGSVTVQMIEGVIGKIELNTADIPKSPGIKYIHYAPKAKMTLVIGEKEAASAKIHELVKETTAKNPAILDMGRKPEEIAANLFADLRRFDDGGHDEIFAQSIDEEGLGAAIMNRLKKAAGKNIIEV